MLQWLDSVQDTHVAVLRVDSQGCIRAGNELSGQGGAIDQSSNPSASELQGQAQAQTRITTRR